MLHFQQTLHPFPGAGMAAIGGLAIGLVQPVGGDAVVGHRLHFPGADLDFDGHPVHTHQYGVQGLVTVGLGNCDVILEFPRHRLVQAVDAAQYPVAGIHRVDDDAEGIDIHDLGKRLPLGLHLLVNAVKVFLPPQYFHLMALLGQGGLDLVADLVYQLLAVAPGTAQGGVDPPGPHRVERVKAEILEFNANGVHTQPLGNRCIDIERFPGYAAGLAGLQHPEGAHVVQAVRQFHQYHPDVTGHRQCHLLEVLRLLFFQGFEFHLGQFTDAVDQFRHGGAKLLADRRLGDARIFYDIVQHGRHQALVVHVHIGEDAGHCQRMGYVLFTTAAKLAEMGLFREVVGALYVVGLLGVEITAQGGVEGINGLHD